MIYFNGQHSHSILKVPKRGDFRVQEEHGSEIVPITPEPALLAAGDAAIAAIGQKLLYARVDLVRSGDAFRVMELELVEPGVVSPHLEPARRSDSRTRSLRYSPEAPARIERAPDAAPSPIEHVRVDHRGLHVRVAEQLLHGADVVAVFEQVRREAVAEGVRARGLRRCRRRESRA